MLYEKLPSESDLAWPLHGMQPRIIRLRRNVTELEQRLTSLEQSVKEEDLVQLAIGLSLQQDNGKPLNKSPKKGSPEGTRNKNGIIKTDLCEKQERPSSADDINKGVSTTSADVSIGTDEKKNTKRENKQSNNERETTITQADNTEKDLVIPSKAGKKVLTKNVPSTDILEEKLSTKGKKLSDSNCPSTAKKSNKKKKTEKREANEGNKSRRGRNKQKKVERYFIDCSQPATDGILQPAELKAYLLERLKVDGKVKNFGDKVKIELDDHIILIDVTDISFSKRYLKYLTKRFLKKNNLRDWLRVVSPASTKGSYQIKYFKFSNDAFDDSSDEE